MPGYKDPPKDKQFPVNRKDHTQKGKYLAPMLKKVLSKVYRCQDPETQSFKKISGNQGLMQVLVWEGLQGNVEAIKEILNRIDGKVIDKTELSGEVKFSQMTPVKIGSKKQELDIG